MRTHTRLRCQGPPTGDPGACSTRRTRAICRAAPPRASRPRFRSGTAAVTPVRCAMRRQQACCLSDRAELRGAAAQRRAFSRRRRPRASATTAGSSAKNTRLDAATCRVESFPDRILPTSAAPLLMSPRPRRSLHMLRRDPAADCRGLGRHPGERFPDRAHAGYLPLHAAQLRRRPRGAPGDQRRLPRPDNSPPPRRHGSWGRRAARRTGCSWWH